MPENLADSVNNVKQETEGAEKSVFNFLNAFATGTPMALDALNKIAGQSAAVKLAILGAGEAYTAFSADLAKSSTGFMTLTDQFNKLHKEIGKIGDTAAASLLRSMLPEQMKAQADEAKNSSKSTSDYVNSLEKMVQSVIASTDQHNLLREQMLMTAGTMGSMDILTDLTNNFSSLEEYVSRTDAQLAAIGSTSGIVKEKMTEYYKEVSKIPGLMQLTYESSQSARSGSDSVLQGLIDFSRGAKIPFDTLTSSVKQLREDFNLKTTGEGVKESGQKIIETLATISEASNKLQLDYATLSKDITETSTKFKYFGDNTIGVTRSIYDMAKGFEAVGLSANNASELAKGFVTRLGELTIGQKAFMSQLTGGPGGAMGAAQIDLKLKQGRIEEIMEDARKAIKSQLGEIVTTEEAAESQEAAGRRLLQIKQLQALGLGAQGEREAGVQLDLLKEQEKGIGKLGSPQELAEKFLKRGEDERQKTATPVKDILTQVEAIRTGVDKISAGTMQYFLGQKMPTQRGDTLVPGLTSGGDIVQPLREVSKQLHEDRMQLQRYHQRYMVEPSQSTPINPMMTSDYLIRFSKALVDSVHSAIEQTVKSKTSEQNANAILNEIKKLETKANLTPEDQRKYQLGVEAAKAEGITNLSQFNKYIEDHMRNMKSQFLPTASTTVVAVGTASKKAGSTTGDVSATPGTSGGESASLMMPLNSGVICAVCHEKLHDLYVKFAKLAAAF